MRERKVGLNFGAVVRFTRTYEYLPTSVRFVRIISASMDGEKMHFRREYSYFLATFSIKIKRKCISLMYIKCGTVMDDDTISVNIWSVLRCVEMLIIGTRLYTHTKPGRRSKTLFEKSYSHIRQIGSTNVKIRILDSAFNREKIWDTRGR